MDRKKSALVTGAGGGIGSAAAIELGRLGFHVIAVDASVELLRAVEQELRNAGLSSESRVVDVGNENSVIDLARWVDLQHGSLDVLVTAAGTISAAEVRALSTAEWERVLRVNLTGTFLFFREFLPLLERAPFARIIAIASDAAKTGEPWLSHYSASKFGVLGLVQSLALEIARTSITVNAICPSIVDTPMMANLAQGMAEATGTGTVDTWKRAFVEEIPMGRPALPDDVAWLISVLVDERSAFLTGQGLNLAGGHEMH